MRVGRTWRLRRRKGRHVGRLAVPGRRPFFCYYGHHKCATRWMVAIFSGLCDRLGLTFAEVHHPAMFENDLREYSNREGVDFLAYTNARQDLIGTVAGSRAIHLIRDPRDIVVSAYFSHLHSHSTGGWPALSAHRTRLQSVSEAEGLIAEIDFIADVLEALDAWDYSQPNVLELKMEDVTASPCEQILEAIDYLGLLDRRRGPFDEQWSRIAERAAAPSEGQLTGDHPAALQEVEVLHAVYSHRFSVLAGGRRMGEEDPHSHYRKGVAGDWKNHFTSQHVTYLEERYPGLVERLGYEAVQG